MPEFHGPSLPPKTVLKNMSEEFLEKRRKALDNYLQVSMLTLTLLHSEWPKLYGVLVILSAIGLTY